MDICFHQASKWLRNSLMFRARLRSQPSRNLLLYIFPL
jgi:hypothetical protein